MWCLKGVREIQPRAIVRLLHDNQVFQDWIFLIDGHNERSQICDSHVKTDATDAITLFESEDYGFFIVCGNVLTFVKVIDDKWKGR
jgi:hypothetical protein